MTITMQSQIMDVEELAAACRQGLSAWTPKATRENTALVLRMYTWAAERSPALTYGQLFAADTIMEYANGENSRVTWRSWETTANAAKAIVRAMDPDASTTELDELRAQARARNTEAARARNRDTPPYGDFMEAAAALCVRVGGLGDFLSTTPADTRRHNATVAYVLSQVLAAPTRERTILYARVADSRSFDPAVAHSADTLRRLREEHPSVADYFALSTFVFDDGEPVALYVGVHGAEHARKAQKYHVIDLTAPILPEAAGLVPALHVTLKELATLCQPGEFLLSGAAPLNKNWGGTQFKKVTGHPVGALRHSVEQRAQQLHEAGRLSLRDLVEVHDRVMHIGATALEKYIAGMRCGTHQKYC